MRDLDQAILETIYADATEEAYLFRLQVNYSGGALITRLVNNDVAIVSEGYTWNASAFEFVPPKSEDGERRATSLLMENVGQALVNQIRGEADPLEVLVSLVVTTDIDTVVAGPWEFVLRNVSYNLMQLRGDLSFDEFLDEPFPAGGDFTPTNFPGLFAAVSELPE